MNPSLRAQLLAGQTGAPAPAAGGGGGGMKDRYEAFTRFCIAHPFFISTLALVTDVKVYDALQECLIAVCSRPESLQIIMALLREEFERKAGKEPGSILRGASLAAKMSSRHARAVGTEYLKSLFSDWIMGIQDLPELNVQVPADKAKLIEVTNEVIEIISRDENVARIPRDVRVMAGLIGALCDEHLPDQKWPLVGGLLLLRLYSPTLISPTTYGLLATNHPMTTAFRKNLMQVTRLIQNASNHQPFKDGPNVALNEWVEEQGRKIDSFLHKVVEVAGDDLDASSPSGSGEDGAETQGRMDEQKTLKVVQLYVQNKAKVQMELDKVQDEALKEEVSEFSELLSACGNPFRQRTGTVAKASQALNLSIGNMANKRAAEQEDFQKTLVAYRWPTDYIKEYFESDPKPRAKTIMLCMLLSNDKHGVPCAPKVGKKENHLVFVGRDAVDWLRDNLNLTDRTDQCLVLLQEMVDLDLIYAWQPEKRDKKGGLKMEDGDRFYWFDYGSIVSTLDSSREPSARSSKRSGVFDDREMKASLSGLQLEKLQGAGILQGGPEGAEEVSSREQWRMLLQIAYGMTFSPVGVVVGGKEGDESARFTVGDVDGWARRYLGFKALDQSTELLKTLLNDGFVFQDGGKYGFHWQKIASWNEKTFGGRKPLQTSSSSTSPTHSNSVTPREQPKSARMSLRGAVTRMGSRNASGGLPADEGSDRPSRPGKRVSNGMSLRGSNSATKLSVSSSGRSMSSQLSAKNTTAVASSSPRQDDPAGDESSSLEERNEGGDSVSMMDFLNQDPDEVAADLAGDDDAPARPEKNPQARMSRGSKSSSSLKNLFGKKDKAKSSGGLFKRNEK